MFERLTRRYGKPVFGLKSTVVDGVAHDVLEEIVWSRPFANLLRFVRPTLPGHMEQPKLLIVAPMSGHYATLLRGTVEAFCRPIRSTSPIGPTRARFRSRSAISISTTTSTISGRFWSISVPGCTRSASASPPSRSS